MSDFPAIETRFTRAYGLRAPIVSAPMAFAGGGRLAAAVSGAGGIGFIGGGYGDAGWIEGQWAEAGNADVGVGFITWRLEGREGLLERALERKPRAVFLSFGDLAPYAGRVKAAGVPLFAQVQTVEGARAALMLGADGVNMGSRFWASAEALVAQAQHTAALAADGDETVRTSLPDMARGYDWPGGWNVRVLRNAWLRGWEGQGDGPVDAKSRAAYAEGVARGDADVAPAIVGEGVGLIRDIAPAGEIVARVMHEARAALDKW